MTSSESISTRRKTSQDHGVTRYDLILSLVIFYYHIFTYLLQVSLLEDDALYYIVSAVQNDDGDKIREFLAAGNYRRWIPGTL